MSSSILRRITAAAGALALGVIAATAPVAPAQAVTLPGNIDPTQARSLTIHKYALGPGNGATAGTGQELQNVTGTPLSGAVFTATRVADVDLTTPAGWSTVANLTPAQAAGRLDVASTFVSEPTDATGEAEFLTDTPTPTVVNFPIGLYLVTETVLPDAATNPAAPFLVTLPFPTGPGGAPANHWV